MLAQRTSPHVAIVGAGRVGRALGSRLRESGWRVGAVVSRSLGSARAATRAIGAGRPLAGIARDVLAADVVLVATPDDAIRGVAEQLAKLVGSASLGQASRGEASRGRASRVEATKHAALRKNSWRGKVVLHTSGALDRAALDPLARRGAATGSLHPLQTFSGHSVPPLRGCICAIEGDAAALRYARRICREIECVPVVLPGGVKAAYHAAATLAAGHVLGVVEAAARMLAAIGFSRRQALRALLPLTRQTLANLERVGAAQAWTGPARRGDFDTVAMHVAALRRFPREFREAYAALSRLSVRVLDARPAAKRRALDRALRGGSRVAPHRTLGPSRRAKTQQSKSRKEQP